MYNLLISIAAAVVVYIGVSLGFGTWIAGILPAAIVLGVLYFLLARRTSQKVQAELEKIMPLLQERKIKEAVELLEGIKQKHRRWQFLLEGQMEAQIGMIDYLQLHFDKALPKLEKGKWRNWAALLCIGAIKFRQDDKDAAFEHFKKASKAAPKEPMVYVVWAVLLTRTGQRAEALQVMADGLKILPGSAILKDIHARIANKKKIKTQELPQQWLQFFPEDALPKELRGRKGPMPASFPQPRPNRKMRRGR